MSAELISKRIKIQLRFPDEEYRRMREPNYKLAQLPVVEGVIVSGLPDTDEQTWYVVQLDRILDLNLAGIELKHRHLKPQYLLLSPWRTGEKGDIIRAALLSQKSDFRVLVAYLANPASLPPRIHAAGTDAYPVLCEAKISLAGRTVPGSEGTGNRTTDDR